ncbi:MAG: AsmA family protein, partial [Planctomycetota bacterium]
MSDESSQDDTPKRRPLRRFITRLVRRAVLLVLLLLAVAVVLYLAWVPDKLAERIDRELTRRLGREVSVGSVTTRLWSPQVTVHQLTVAAAEGTPGEAPLLSIDTMNVSMNPLQALWGGDDVVEEVACRNVKLAVSIDRDGRLSVQDILELQQAPEPPDRTDQPDEPEPGRPEPDAPGRPVVPSRVELSDVEFTLVDARIEGELVARMPQATLRTWFSGDDTRHHGWSVPGIDVAGRSRDGASTHGQVRLDPQGNLEEAQATLNLQAGDLDLVHQWLNRFAETDLSTLEATSPKARLSMQYRRGDGTVTITGTASGTRLETPAGVFDNPHFTLERAGLDGLLGRVALQWQLTVDGARLVQLGGGRIADIGTTRVAASVDVATDHPDDAGVPLWRQPLVMLDEPIRQLQLNKFDVEGGGAVIHGSLLAFDLPRAGRLASAGGRRHLRDHAWGYARLIVSKHEDALDDWLVELGARVLGELPDYGGKTRLVVQANRGRPGRSKDNLTLHAGLATESIDYKGNVLSGNVEGSLDGTWRRGDDHLELATSLAGQRLELIGENPSDRLVLNSVSNRNKVELQLAGAQLERARLDVETMVLESDQLVQRVHGQLDRVPLARLRPTLAALYDTLVHAGRIDLAIETERLAPAPLLENLTLPGMRQVSSSLRRAVQEAYREHPTVMEAVRHQLELQSVKADSDATAQVLGSLGRVLRPSRPMPLEEFADRFRPVGQLHGSAHLSKAPDSTALVLDHDLVLGDVQLEFVGPMQRRLPLHPDGLPWRLRQHLVLDNLVVRPHHIGLDLHGHGHLEPTENASTRISWQGRLDTGRGTLSLAVEG